MARVWPLLLGPYHRHHTLESTDKHKLVLAYQPLVLDFHCSASSHRASRSFHSFGYYTRRGVQPSLSHWIVLFQTGMLPSLRFSGLMTSPGCGFAGAVWPAEKTRKKHFLCFRPTGVSVQPNVTGLGKRRATWSYSPEAGRSLHELESHGPLNMLALVTPLLVSGEYCTLEYTLEDENHKLRSKGIFFSPQIFIKEELTRSGETIEKVSKIKYND